ncbi:MAG: outer membrane lipoprotein-sorting protein [Spirochaetales bacterium]|nr:outer membrane lipoprotein-sorting protein [Spirochaetales bacterium]HPO03035.1 outer membrane lipoprotein-sorting protein [Treponemataceae bacterium]
MNLIVRFFSAALVCAAVASNAAAQSAPDWTDVLRRIDELGDFENSDFSAEITVVSKVPNKDDSTIVARYFRRDSENKFTIVLLKPDIQKGQGYFSVGDDVWFYDPESGKFAYSSLKDSFQDSDAQNSDFSSSSLETDYSVSSYEESKLGGADVWVLSLEAKSRTVAVAKRKMWVRKDNLLVLKEEHYSTTDRLMRTLAYPKYQTVSGKYVPLSILIVDNLKSGERTQITFASPSVSRLPDSVFHKEYLQQVR